MKRRSTAVPTRERILDEVERLIASKGVHGFKLRDVAEPLRLQVPAIYKHYRDRDDVLVEVSRRFIRLLAGQFQPSPGLTPAAGMRVNLDRLVEFNIRHPAYVRLELVDLATPRGGVEDVKRAACGPFDESLQGGHLADMHRRLRAQLAAGARAEEFRRVNATDFYRVIKAALLIRLVFPNAELLLRSATRAEIRIVQRWLWKVASGYLAPRNVVPKSRRPAKAPGKPLSCHGIRSRVKPR